MAKVKLIAQKITSIDSKDLTIGLITVLEASIVDTVQQSDVGSVKVDDENTLPWKEKGRMYPSLRLSMGYLANDGSFQRTTMFCNQGNLTRNVKLEDGSKDLVGTDLGYLLDATGVKVFNWNQEAVDIKEALQLAKEATKAKKEAAEENKADVDSGSDSVKSALELAKAAKAKPVKDEEVEVKTSDSIYADVYAKDQAKLESLIELIEEKVINEDVYLSVRFDINDAGYIKPDYSTLKVVEA